jgi:cell wall-associated NlpC family hydrolase
LQANAVERRVTKYDGKGIIGIAEKYLGTPYRYGGNTPSGFDCSGFTSYVYDRAGYNLPRATTAQYGKLNPVRVPEVGDLVFFRTSGNRVSHVGIYVGNYQFIHAPSSGKTVGYADIRNSYWKPRYAGSRTIFRKR